MNHPFAFILFFNIGKHISLQAATDAYAAGRRVAERQLKAETKSVRAASNRPATVPIPASVGSVEELSAFNKGYDDRIAEIARRRALCN